MSYLNQGHGIQVGHDRVIQQQGSLELVFGKEEVLFLDRSGLDIGRRSYLHPLFEA